MATTNHERIGQALGPLRAGLGESGRVKPAQVECAQQVLCFAPTGPDELAQQAAGRAAGRDPGSRALASPARPPVLASPVGDAAGAKERAALRRYQRELRVGELLTRAESAR